MNRLISILCIIVLFISSCNSKVESTVATTSTPDSNIVQVTDAQLKNAVIETGKLNRRPVSAVLKVNGKVDVPPQNMVSISFPLGGYLKSTNLLSGMHVTKGQVIAVMEDQQYIQLQQDYLTAKARISFLEKEYNRQKELNESKATSDKVLEQTEADFRSQQILVGALSQKLQLIGVNTTNLQAGNISRTVNVTSPINGFVSKVNVNIGKYVNPTDVLFEIVNPADIHLALTVFEKDIPSLSINQKVVAYTNTDPSKKYACKIILIGQDIGADRSVEVHCHFEKYDKQLIPGTFMNAEIETTRNEVMTLPEDAVVFNGGRQYVFVAHDQHTFEMKEVKTGTRDNGFIEIADPNNDQLQNELIVIKGAYTLLMKLKNSEEE
jgi:membrane fusion protein, heavy metal efflux system